jgi:hypothetical protein
MKKKILIGSILVLTLLLLLPSIQAIQHTVVKDKIVNEIPEELHLEKRKTLTEFGPLDRIKHPLLYLFIIFISLPRILRIEVFGELSYSGDWPFHITVENKLLFLRYVMLLFTTAFWFYMWNTVSIVLGWNWNI